MREKKIEDKELGTITLLSGPRHKRYALKVREGAIRATMPLNGDEKKMLAFIEENRAKLIRLLREYPSRSPLTENTRLQTASFRLEIIRAERKNIRVRLSENILTIEYPAHLSIEEEYMQQKMHEILKNVFRHEAKRVLPARLEMLSRQYGFTYTGLKINSSRTRWGSCTTRKSINLSLYLMQLPWHLIDYVILHELCHTREMNHSDRFWALMDQVTDNRSKALRKELKERVTISD